MVVGARRRTPVGRGIGARELGRASTGSAPVGNPTRPAAERKCWAMRLPNLAKEWADRMEKRGLPGRKVVKTFMDEARAMKVSIAQPGPG